MRLSSGLQIRPLTRFEELSAAVDLQRDVWGYGEADVDSRAILVIAGRYIGHVLGAFDGEKLVGFALSFHTQDAKRMHSHRVGVLPDYQNQGVGRRLKLAQREASLGQGVEIVQWTFDPLQPRNAYFNLMSLGGIARAYIPDFYGVTSSPLHGGLPTDRLLIEWELRSHRVAATLAGRKYEPENKGIQIELRTEQPRSDAAQQARVREAFQKYLPQGYVVTGFTSSKERDFYTLELL